MINVLVTCGGGFQGMTLYKSLKNIKGTSLHLFDINTENVSKYFFDFNLAMISPLGTNELALSH